MKNLSALCLTAMLPLLLAACVSTPVAPPPGSLFDDKLFAPTTERISADDVFAVSDAMRRYLRKDIAGLLQAKGPQQGLIKALRTTSLLHVQYDSAMTRNAAQTFDERAGNCLSLVLMTAALAKELGMAVRYQSVFVEESWSRSGDLVFSLGHVNLNIGTRYKDNLSRIDDDITMTIDFSPPAENRRYQTRDISEQTVLAMYMNNRSAEALARGQINDAYWWAREAIKQDPGFTSAYNTLGVVYRRHGNPANAEQAFNQAMLRDPENTLSMANLAIVLDETGRVAEAKILTEKVQRRQPFPPFHFHTLGMKAMQAGDFDTAREMFQREIARDPYNHEFHFGLAAALAQLGDLAQSKRHLTIAMDYSSTRREHDLYAAKLARIKARL
ncbi:MAG: tetratricopeptide repeat protein [Burkholderiales bacterium]|nr:tetratricopeptide repeat protein [Burkholderiales bacterium]